MEYTGLYYSEDIQFKETSAFDLSVLNAGTVFYEVIRINDGTALFLEDHLQRLQASINSGGYKFHVSDPVIHYLLRNLIKRNNTANGNVKILVHFSEAGKPVIYSFFVPHFYPGQEMYSRGVSTSLYKAERQDPNIKKVRKEMSASIDSFIKSRGIYDVLLVDSDGNITEGSRTNVFFIQGDRLLTPPPEMVLKGVTRSKILILCNQLNIQLIETNISSSSLNNFDSAFFSGTSPKILPINRIDDYEFDSQNQLCRRLMKAYDELIAGYLGNN